MARHLANKASLHLLFGEKAARAYDRLLRLELANQQSGKRSAFATAEEALEAAHRFLLAIGQAVRKAPVNLEGLPMAPRHVLPHAREIRAAAHALGLPPGCWPPSWTTSSTAGTRPGALPGVREVADGVALTLGRPPFPAPWAWPR